MSAKTDDKSPFGPGFIAACIVVGAVLVCGLLLVAAGHGSSDSSGAQQSVGSGLQQSTSSGVQQPVQPNQPAQPATPAASSEPAKTGGASSCNLPAGDQAVPNQAPAVDGWDVSHKVVVPHSSRYGPAKTDPDGFRRCFAHSPTGAVYAAYNVIAAVADQSQVVPAARKLMLPGPATDALIREVSDEEPSGGSMTTQVAGFRILAADPDRVTLMLAFPVESAISSGTLTMVWYDGDWRVQPPPPGEAVGAPFASHRDLTDFVTWSGI